MTRFQSGGILRDDAFYVPRPADEALFEALAVGELCHVLAPRQIGKSSLRVRVARRLAAAGVRCGAVDLTIVGTEGDASAWYFGVLEEVARTLGRPDPLEYWEAHPHMSPVHRWTRYFEIALGSRDDGAVVVFVDEIDLVRALSFSGDDFLASIRAVHERQTERPEAVSVTFCLIGVAAPGDLIGDPNRTPFNIGRRIQLEDFSRAECDVFAPGFAGRGSADAWLDAVYAWTAGHPYMTQRICERVADEAGATGEIDAAIAAAVEALFLRRPMEDGNLSYAERRVAVQAPGASSLEKFSLYRRIYFGGGVPCDARSRVQTELLLAGLVKESSEDGEPVLVARNRVFASVFDEAWIREHAQEGELWQAVNRWLESDGAADYALSGRDLEAATDWARAQPHVTQEMNAFLRAGLERDKVRAQTRADARLKWLLSMFLTGGLLVALLLALTLLYFDIEDQAKAQTLRALQAEAENRALEDVEQESELVRHTLARVADENPAFQPYLASTVEEFERAVAKVDAIQDRKRVAQVEWTGRLDGAADDTERREFELEQEREAHGLTFAELKAEKEAREACDDALEAAGHKERNLTQELTHLAMERQSIMKANAALARRVTQLESQPRVPTSAPDAGRNSTP